jgi:fatty acid desaturase
VVSDEPNPLPYLNKPERVLLGPLVRRLFATGNPRFQKALETTGAEATARMACVNALRIYAILLFVLGVAARLAGVTPLALLFYGVAVVAMVWSFWCLYTVAGPEREFKREHEDDEPAPARAALDALLRKLGREGEADDRAV